MPNEPRKDWWRNLLTAAHYGFPILVLIGAWIAFHEGDVGHESSSVEMYLLCSAVIILVVFTGESVLETFFIKRRLEKQAKGLHKQDAELASLHKRLTKLENAVNARKESPTSIKPSIFTQELPEQTISNSHISQPYPNDATVISREELPNVAAEPRNFSEEEVIRELQREFTEVCRNMNRDLRQIINRMQSLIEVNAPSEIRAIRVSRDGAIEESTIYRVDASNIAAPKDSVAVLLGGGRALLFPAPLAGEDSFVDAKAFDCELPVHLRRRSQLADCLPARLTETSRDVYELLNNGKGTLRFHHG
jgi:hypothetical protein